MTTTGRSAYATVGAAVIAAGMAGPAAAQYPTDPPPPGERLEVPLSRRSATSCASPSMPIGSWLDPAGIVNATLINGSSRFSTSKTRNSIFSAQETTR